MSSQDWPQDLAERETDTAGAGGIEAAIAAGAIPIFRPRDGSSPKYAPPRRFRPPVAWFALPPAERRRLGELALTLAYARAAAPHIGPERAVGFAAAEHHALALLDRLFAGHFPLCHAGALGVPLPDLSRFGIRACRECGCTDAAACPEGCAWLEPDPESGPLCSACAGRLAGIIRPW